MWAEGAKRSFCRKESSKRKRRRAASLSSGKRKLKRNLLNHARTKKGCSWFTMLQQGPTCYMSAASLAFHRLLLRDLAPVNSGDDRKQAVRKFVLLSASKRADEGACPSVPTDVRRIYTLTEAKFKAVPLTENTRMTFYAPLRTETVERYSTLDGGQPHIFLSSLLWSVGAKCVLMIRTAGRILRRENGRSEAFTDPLPDSEVAKICAQDPSLSPLATGDVEKDAIPLLLKFTPTEFVVYNVIQSSDVRLPDPIDRNLEAYRLAFLSEGVRVLAVLIGVCSEVERDDAHVVSCFPCHNRQGRVVWMFCNSWNDRKHCIPAVNSGVQQLGTRFGMPMLVDLTFLLTKE